jgi:uncharacterized low-complexity protein
MKPVTSKCNFLSQECAKTHLRAFVTLKILRTGEGKRGEGRKEMGGQGMRREREGRVGEGREGEDSKKSTLHQIS